MDPDCGPRPSIELSELLPQDLHDDRRAVVGDYLDNDSSAYDSQDAEAGFHEDYEMNSFIDDTTQESSNDVLSESSSDGETDYMALYKELASRHKMLLNNFQMVADEYEELRYDVLGTDDESDLSNFDEMDDDGLLLVDVSAPEPVVVTELVLSQPQEGSQDAEIFDDAARDRAAGFEAATSADGQGWHNISLVSTTDNHTYEEIEL